MARYHRSLLSVLALALVAALLSGCPSDNGGSNAGYTPLPPGTTEALPPSAVVPAGLPQHLGLGLMNNPVQLDWMASSGIAWDYRYQYLTGGVNTGSGWSTWGYPAGSFVDDYLGESAQNGYIPVFTYYQVVASAPDPGSEDVLPKLRDASTMRAYFDDWESLVRQLGAFGKTVVVHLEPDLWGYLQREDGDAAKVAVLVNSSGAPSVAGFDDTAAGFAQALVHLRDIYAPNVLLGFHVSAWATGKDLILNQADPVETAAEIGAFYRSLGVDFDLLFLDASDRDAAWYQAQTGTSRWWGAADFERFRSFVASAVGDMGKRAVIWQVPIGNTLYRSMNNSWGHYQDNRAQYWLGDRSRMEQLADAGVVALLFGAGADGCTMYTDEMQDGVTNPSPINGNDATAQYADDDGGQLRLRAAEYYRTGAVGLTP